MILLDTNVLSECMRPDPSARVMAWLDAQAAGQLWVCAISRAEIELGIALLVDGRRKHALRTAAEAMFAEDFGGRCLSFDAVAASRYAALVSSRMRLGRPISVEDAQIAAIALAHGMTLATRHTRDFEAIEGLLVVDPWQTAA
ncbi:MAG: type II toxin-antitoxin system VapC family toxin [Thiomonas sp.]